MRTYAGFPFFVKTGRLAYLVQNFKAAGGFLTQINAMDCFL